MGRSQKNLTNNNIVTIASYASTRFSCPVDPPEVQSTIRLAKTLSLTIPSVTSTAKTVTVADLAGQIPGGLTYWNRIRFNSFKIWASAEMATASTTASKPSPVLKVANVIVAGGGVPLTTWTDTGTAGSRRPGIAFYPPIRERTNWYGPGVTEPVVTVSISNAVPEVSSAEVIIHANVELMSVTA